MNRSASFKVQAAACLLFLVCLFFSQPALAALRVAVAPIEGDARYPLVMNGLRQVLVTDLAQSGQFDIQDVNVADDQLTVSNLPNLAADIGADVILLSRFVEASPKFTVTVRAYDMHTAYNLGSRSLTGTYAEIKFAQDRLLSIALDLLRTPLPIAQQSAISNAHTQHIGAVVAMGEADVALKEDKHLEAVEGFARSRAMDRQFRAAQFRLERTAPTLVRKINDPTQRGLALAYLGDAKESMTQFDDVLKKDPSNVGAILGKGDLLMQIGRADEARASYEQASALEPQNAKAAVGLAQAYQKSGQGKKAFQTYERARSLGSTDPEVYESLGTFYSQQKNKKAAADAYQTGGELAERTAELQKAEHLYSKATRIDPSVISMQKTAQLYMSAGQIDLAITTLTKAIFLAPTNDEIYSRLGYAYYINGQVAEAEKKLRRAHDLNPSNYRANYYLGRILFEDRDTQQEAVKYLENAASLRPTDTETHYHLAQAYLKVKKADLAIGVLQKLSRTHPRDALVHRYLADAFYLADNFDHAEEAYLRAVELRPDDQAALEGLAKVYLKKGKRDEAMETIEKVYAIDASNNVFVREGPALLSGMTSKELIALTMMFPKTVPGGTASVAINQVAMVRLKTRDDLVGQIKKLFNLYILDEARIKQDLEFSLFSQYRIVPNKKLHNLASGKMAKADFELDNHVSDLVTAYSLDGIFGWDVLDVTSNDGFARVTVDMALYTREDSGRYGIQNKAQLPQVLYPSKEVLRFNFFGLLAGFGGLFLFAGPILYLTTYRAKKRGYGNIRVVINYDPKMESFLTLKLSKKQEKEKDSRLIIVQDKAKYEKQKFKQLLKQKGAWVRRMVGGVTVFEKVPVREYFCYLYGTIEDTKILKQTIGNYYMVQKVLVEKGKTKDITFQLEKLEAFVTVFVRKGDEDISGAEIKVPGDKEIKYSRGAQGAFCYLKKGTHRITVKHGDRTVEQVVDIFNLDDKIVNIDLQTADEAEEAAIGGRDLKEVAQEFQEQGRMEDAARLYEKAGSSGMAGEVRAQAQIDQGNVEGAAEELVKAREFWKAAELYRSQGHIEKANYLYGVHAYQEGNYDEAAKYLEQSENHALLAKIYDRMGDKKKARISTAKAYLAKGQKIEAAQAFVHAEAYVDAAELYESLEDFPKAALLYVKDGNFSLAGDLFARAGDIKKAAMAFEKGGILEQAIAMYRDLGDVEKVIELLTREERYLEAAKLYQEQGLSDEAIALCQKIPDYHTDFPATRLLLSQMFVEKGMDDLALKTFKEAKETGQAQFNSDASYAYACLLERQNDFVNALQVFEELLTSDFHYKDVSVKVNELKAKATQQKSRQAAASNVSETIAGAAPEKDSRYEVQEELGRGAMGVVYKAKDKMLDRIVAFKTLPHTLKDDSAALESLLKEAQTAAKLNHPNIVTVFDVGQENGNYFIAMEFVQGKTLQQVLKQVKKVDLSNFLHISQALCDVIGYAHEQKVIHRDVKPSNILLMPNRTVKLMDFGLAKVLQDMSIDKTMLRGTPLYMSPEQVLGKDIDHRTDIYSLGILFYEMLAGAPPFTKGDIMYAHLHTPPPPLQDLAPEINGTIVDMVMSCLSKDKTGRPATARDLGTAISKAAT